MGCAAWRARSRLLEHAALAPIGGTLRGGPVVPLRTSSPGVLGLNEVGVTDAIMATLWQFGPRAAAYAVSQGAESNHLGADIAIIHSSTDRLLLYQSKLGRVEADQLTLKSPVTASQGKLLRRRRVPISGRTYDVTGRLAIYQCDSTPFISRCDHHLEFEWWHRWSPWRRGQRFEHDPAVGRWYYENALSHCGCSSSGVLACARPDRDPTSEVPLADTWPWEFDLYRWFEGGSPFDSPGGDGRRLRETAPDFEPYRPGSGEPRDLPGVDELASELAGALGLPESYRLFVIQL